MKSANNITQQAQDIRQAVIELKASIPVSLKTIPALMQTIRVMDNISLLLIHMSESLPQD